MVLIIIFSLQYYFLAKLFKKNKFRTILNAIGLYLLGGFVSIFILSFILSFKIVDLGLDLDQFSSGKLDTEALKANSQIINDFLIHNNIPIIMNVILFVLIGVVYYNYLKNKWMREMLTERQVSMDNSKQEVDQPVQFTLPVQTNFYCHFHQVNDKNIHWVPELAQEIWNDCYKDILSQEQIDYMLDMMYNPEKILEGVENNEQWEILKADNVPVGYLHYKIEEDKVFLSKIYLKQDPQYKGLGQVMMNHVIDYALANQKKKIYLTVNKNNSKAIRFYEKNGFRNVKSETFDIGNGYIMDDYIFQKDLI